MENSGPRVHFELLTDIGKNVACEVLIESVKAAE